VVGSIFNEGDIKQMEARGITQEKLLSQIDLFRKGFPFSRLLRPCTVGDGLTVLEETDLEAFGQVCSQAAVSGRVMKFVPASGAASRMFKLLLSFNNRYDRIDGKVIFHEAEKGDPDHKEFLMFIQQIKRFAFYDELKSAMARDSLDIEALISEGQYKDILEYVLSPKGLNLAGLPKGLIPFHRYPAYSRTPFEEHLVEANTYARDDEGVVRVHFTMSVEHEDFVRMHIEEIRGRLEGTSVRYEINFSNQKPSTDTIAVDMENRPFRDNDGKLVFRPGGHGALLENLSDLDGDIVFIKNIDNIVPDRLKDTTFIYKKALGGYLLDLQGRIFDHLKRLLSGNADDRLVKDMFEFAREVLSIIPPQGVERGTMDERTEFLVSMLNRPLRVCGMVRNEGEPGGGPFWVEHADKSSSLQIVESSQVDMSSIEQKAIWESSTHFNPVDLVCGLCDYSGAHFDLQDYVDQNAGFISIKSIEGRELKALELPGLWNGSMANWNTVFLEVPIITFNPVKTTLDLLRKEHQPEGSV